MNGLAFLRLILVGKFSAAEPSLEPDDPSLFFFRLAYPYGIETKQLRWAASWEDLFELFPEIERLWRE